MSRSVFIETLERGVTAHQAGRLDDALRSYRAALEIRPNDPEASSLYGLALLHSGKARRGDAAAAACSGARARSDGFRLNLAEGLAQTGKPDRAMVELGLIIATDPTNAAALSRFYALESDTLIARRDWQKLYVNGVAWTKADPKAPGAWRMLARGALEQGWHVEATTAFARFLMLTKPTVADFTAYASLCLQALDVEHGSQSARPGGGARSELSADARAACIGADVSRALRRSRSVLPSLFAAEARLRARLLDVEPLAARCAGRCGPASG